jgi:transcriptional regulator with XRE-family HTH domain
MATDICILLGERIRDLRNSKQWNQIDLATQADISENYVSDLELGKKEICLRMLQRVAVALDKTTAELLTGLD